MEEDTSKVETCPACIGILQHFACQEFYRKVAYLGTSSLNRSTHSIYFDKFHKACTANFVVCDFVSMCTHLIYIK
jgi:hypothetical protein